VLYVEDSAVNARLMSQVFARFRPDLSLDIAADGQQGLRMFEDLHPVLLLLDYHLPDTTGLAILQAIRGSGNQLPVFIVTADARTELATAVAAAGGNGVVTKPFEIRSVLDLVENELPSMAIAR